MVTCSRRDNNKALFSDDSDDDDDVNSSGAGKSQATDLTPMTPAALESLPAANCSQPPPEIETDTTDLDTVSNYESEDY